MYRITGYANEFLSYSDAQEFCDSRGLDYSLIYDEEQVDN